MDTSRIPDSIPSGPPGDDWSRVHLHVIIDARTPDIPEEVKDILNEDGLELWFYSNHEEPNVTYVSGTGETAEVPYIEVSQVANPVLGGLLTVFAKCAHFLISNKNTSFLSLK